MKASKPSGLTPAGRTLVMAITISGTITSKPRTTSAMIGPRVRIWVRRETIEPRRAPNPVRLRRTVSNEPVVVAISVSRRDAGDGGHLRPRRSTSRLAWDAGRVVRLAGPRIGG